MVKFIQLKLAMITIHNCASAGVCWIVMCANDNDVSVTTYGELDVADYEINCSDNK